LKKKIKIRNPFAGLKGKRRWGAGNHGDKKRQESKDKCRKFDHQNEDNNDAF
jgi:hypothetical protein